MKKLFCGLLVSGLMVSLSGVCMAAGWEAKWKNTVAEAKKEGSVTVYSIWAPQLRGALTQAFKKKYGINLEFSFFGKGSQLVAKVQAEQRAGLYVPDFYGSGTGTTILLAKPAGILGPIDPLLILPEVLDPNAWRNGSIPFLDKEHQAISMIANTIRTVVYNTSLIKEGEITTYKDFLKPQYKGKITMIDPSVTGMSCFAHLGLNLWGDKEAADFLRKLIKEQDVNITRDNRLHVETVARGKYAIGFGPSMTTLVDLMKAGAPLKLAIVEEDNRTSGGSGGFGVPRRFTRPNATIVFVNWLLSKEGQTVFAKNYGMPSTRADVSTERIDPLFVPLPGKKYYSETEEFFEARAKWLKIADKIIREETALKH